MIGTLIETNERIIAALEMYDMAVGFKAPPALSRLTKLHSYSCQSPLGRRKASRTFRRAWLRQR